jgi:hypothetical protein
MYPGDGHLSIDDSLPDYYQEAAALVTKRVLSLLESIA